MDEERELWEWHYRQIIIDIWMIFNFYDWVI
jgi:hypothetical protein